MKAAKISQWARWKELAGRHAELISLFVAAIILRALIRTIVRNHRNEPCDPHEKVSAHPSEPKCVKPEEPRPWRRRVKRRLHPYAGLLSLMGIMIVLGTFIVKDVLRDRQKDLLEALEATNAKWALSQSLNSLDSRLVLGCSLADCPALILAAKPRRARTVDK